MLFMIQNQRNGTDFLHQRPKVFQLSGGYLRSRREDVKGVFQKRYLGVGKASAFASGHGVAAYEAMIESGFMDSLVNRSFDAAHIGEKAARGHNLFDGTQIAVIFLYRST